MPETINWKLEAQKQAAAAGELKIALAKRMKEINTRIENRKCAIGNTVFAPDEAEELSDILTKDLMSEAYWIDQLLKTSK